MAEDALQTSYLKILEGRARFEGRSTFRTWLFSVIRNTAADIGRSPWRRRIRSLSAKELQTPQPVTEEGGIDLTGMAEALSGLAPRQAEVLTLMYGHGMTVLEASKVLGISQGSAATHLHRGKVKLREYFVERDEDK